MDVVNFLFTSSTVLTYSGTANLKFRIFKKYPFEKQHEFSLP